ncbi:DUF2510 domain-containing protein [Timonella sp. A28]|uniref:DUF2510 domain-containing protein n=1 Tax=Timonella sp. A28 TaxID=3442640 RepID=UPI003EB9CCCD
MPTAIPGWYPDPTNSLYLRFFNGKYWTDVTVLVPSDGQVTEEMIFLGEAKMSQLHTEQCQHPANYHTAQNGAAHGTRAVGVVAGRKISTQQLWLAAGLAAFISVFCFYYVYNGTNLAQAGKSRAVHSITVSQDFSALNLASEFTCKNLAQEAIDISQAQDAGNEVLVDVKDVSIVRDARSTFSLPSTKGKYETALACEGEGVFADGMRAKIELELSVTSDSSLWVYSTPRSHLY